MPPADSAYAIGVIREWEKGLLEEDEYTRLRNAATPRAAVEVLLDTPYGKWITVEQPQSAFKAFGQHLEVIHSWIRDTVEDERVWQFISARYDGLNVATALLEFKQGAERVGELSRLGSITPTVLQETLWHTLAWDQLPEVWERFIKEELALPADTSALLERMARQVGVVMHQLALTPMMDTLAELYETRSAHDRTVRPWADGDALAYERDWDTRQLDIVKHFRLEPLGYNPIIGFWYAKTLEVKTLRLVLSAKLAGMQNEALRAFETSLYRSWT